ncbi:hypothetical protein M1M07_26270 [Rhodococcus sp. HM1]|uniref:hypothetical protein n=1 Tax=Rhodococcus sp. HM1 TaxID=2937759 RepID=UPI00200B918E|nr:hypothetical protein [Rhodococcus sp. HM1]MCK8674603.1 hypothetical protein [Rhodococcus sp. HM1]
MDTWWTALQLLAPAFWLGSVFAISFLEAPLKFRAPGVTIPIGLGIGRLVFRALSITEVVILVVLWIATLAATAAPTTAMWWLLGTATVVLPVQVLGVRPALTRRSDQVLAGAELPRSRAHYVYVALEVVKVLALVALIAVSTDALLS